MSQEKSKTMAMQIFFFLGGGGGGVGVKEVYYGICASSELTVSLAVYSSDHRPLSPRMALVLSYIRT